MSTGVYNRYQLDPTGTNPDNLVSAEVQDLSDRPLRFVVPKHGPFYVESLVVYDSVTMQPLQSSQYKVPMIAQEPTLRFGKEIADSFLIEDSNVAARVLVTYQALGGNFQNNIANVVNIYESFLNDNRAIDWMTGVFGKPATYPPGEHAHHLADLFGWESLTFVMERIRDAIILSNVPGYDMIFNALQNRNATINDIDNGSKESKVVTLDVLQYAAARYNFNKYELYPMVGSLGNNDSIVLTVKATTPLESDILYWEIEHITSLASDFIMNSGTVNLYRGEGAFTLQTIGTNEPEEEKSFKINFFRGGLDKVKLFSSFEMTLRRYQGVGEGILDAFLSCCLKSPALQINPVTLSMHRGVWNAKQS